MALQILGLRHFERDGQTLSGDAFHERRWRCPTLAELFADTDKVLAPVPSDTRWNLFYTIAECGEGKREFHRLTALAFDIDAIDTEKIADYIPHIATVLKTDPWRLVQIASGNGLHIILGLTKDRWIKNAADFKVLRPHYKELCAKIDAALTAAGLPGKADPAIFEARRLLRLPGTVNRKEGKPERQCRRLGGTYTEHNYNIKAESGLPDVAEKDAVHPALMRRLKKTDTAAVMGGCAFLKWAADHQAEVSEPQWYAALSVVGRLADGRTLAHDISRGHPQYSEDTTTRKLNQALEASGPRTCDAIGSLWEGCPSCPNFSKVKSPILLVGKDTIASEGTGFHHVQYGKDGTPKFTPDFDGLRRFFERETHYKNLGPSAQCYVWDKTHYVPFEGKELEGFAQAHFEPHANTNMVREFRELVSRTNLLPVSWWEDTTRRKVNFKNGYLDIDSGLFMPSSTDHGFRYVLPYAYDPDATAPLWDKTMVKVFGGDASMIAIFNEFAGYAISGDDCWTQKCLVLEGEGSNGKSTLLNTLKAAIGDDSCASVNITELEKSEYTRAMLDHKLINISEETPTKSMANTSLFKTMVTGGHVQARAIYKNPYTFANRAKLLFTCNELPHTHDTTHGFFRRLIVLPFTQTFSPADPDFDPHLEKKLLTELPGIFNGFLAAYRKVRARGAFTTSETVAKRLEEYRHDTDTVVQWIADNCELTGNGHMDDYHTPLGDMWEHYSRDCKLSGQFMLHRPRFFRRLAQVIPDYATRKTHTGTHNNRQWVLRGVRLLAGGAAPLTTEQRLQI